MTNSQRVRWVTTTGLMIALLIALQWATAPTQVFAGQYITGSLVNCVLAVATMLGGMYCGIVVALLSPFCAFLLGIGPQLIQIIPIIALGNAALVIVLHLLGKPKKAYWHQQITVLQAAIAKFGVLYLGVNWVLIPLMGSALPAKKAAMFQVMFSYPQIITAAIGGTVALLLMPLLKKTMK